MLIVNSHKNLKYASNELVIKEYLNNYFNSIAVNTAYHIENMIMIAKKESRLDYDLELVVMESDIISGYIMPGYTSLNFEIDRAMNDQLSKVNMFSSIYEYRKDTDNANLEIASDECNLEDENLELPSIKKEYNTNVKCLKNLRIVGIKKRSNSMSMLESFVQQDEASWDNLLNNNSLLVFSPK